ncbi:hypothetical protein SAMN04515671_3778 [Nakamurella panacisegetis]|uniref:DUF4145 domain-containing protein n=1 Tax=Nakamurella panacisegetis TaxID=1090615 RepID=A0A1H0RWC3_9ACTN|nr:hypothetical protein SAMN04515671_3778 [Nakamurella panacisegetis]
MSLGGSGDWLGFAQVDQPIVNHDQPFEERLTLPISDEQLAVLEDRRAGADLTFHVQFHVTLGYPRTDGPPLWPSSSNHDQQLLIQGGTWERLLAQTSSGFSLAIVVPVPLGQDSAAVKAGDHLRTALRKLTAGEYDDAVVSARKAIETLGSPGESEKAIVSTTKADERTLAQRSTMLRHALFNLASPAAHGDENASEIHWDRAGAMSVIAGVSTLVATWNRQ